MSTDIRSEAPVTPFFSTNFKYYYYFFFWFFWNTTYYLSACLRKVQWCSFLYVAGKKTTCGIVVTAHKWALKV